VRGLVSAALMALVLIAPAACKRKKKTRSVVEDSGVLSSVVNVSDPAASGQLVRGFYVLESNAWRWTMPKFTVALKPPPGAAQKGGRLSLKFNIPEVIFNKLGPMNLRASINGLALPPETYSKAGDYIYAQDVPANALSGDAVSVEFTCDKALPPSGDDARELALVVTSIGLESRGLESR
jgi:hypothetical protein